MMMLSTVDNMAYSGNIVQEAWKALEDRLPRGWRLRRPPRQARAGKGIVADAVISLAGPGDQAASIIVETKSRLEPQHVESLVAGRRADPSRPILVVAPFLSPRTRERLAASGLNFADLTGNIRLSLSKPALFIDARGADENPTPVPRERSSLKGAKAGRLVRSLCDFRPPIGLRDLAKRAGVDAGYASRVVQNLIREALVTRTGRGPITTVDWAALLRRWSEEYSPTKSGRATWFLAPRGLQPIVDMLKKLRGGYVVSGSWAANLLAPVAPARLLLCYADDVSALAKRLDLRQVDAGMNVVLAQPFDPVVAERTSKRDGLTIAAPSQVVADLLTSPGRGPDEAEALIEWMGKSEQLWRTESSSRVRASPRPRYHEAVPTTSLTDRRKDILDLARRHGARNLRLFGSEARGDARPDSDIDLLVDMEDGRSLLDLIGLSQDLEDLLGRHVDVVTASSLHPRIRENVLADARPL
jgi:predicted nucleotidyltransferase